MKPFAVLLHYKNYNEPYCNIDSESDYFGLLFWNLNKKTGDSPTVSFITLTFLGDASVIKTIKHSKRFNQKPLFYNLRLQRHSLN